MITFYPGPSKVNSKLPGYFRDAFLDGVLSINHRTPEFESIYEGCVTALKEKLLIPEDYVIMFASSATECWEIIAQSLVNQESYHLYNGAFGEKWYDYTKKLKPGTRFHAFDMQELLDVEKLAVPSSAELIAITQNETSNGTEVTNSTIRALREKYPDPLIAVDATSSMGGIALEFGNADLWYASVQKCFGLPAGLAVMICSPKVLEKAAAVKENDHYNSLSFMIEKMQVNQTTYTPNVLHIYLLMRVMQAAPSIRETAQKVVSRYEDWLSFFGNYEMVNLLIENDKVRSRTVLTLKAAVEKVANIKKRAKEAGIVLGNGYGELKSCTFRIANFPAIKNKEIRLLMEFFSDNLTSA